MQSGGSRWELLRGNSRPALVVRLYLIHVRFAKLEAMVKREQASIEATLAEGSVVLERGVDEDAMAFHLQGNIELNTAINLKARMKHRAAPRIVQVLRIWRDTALRSECSSLESPSISREGHAMCLRPVYRALMEEYDPGEADSAIAEDWEADSRSQGQLSSVAFGDAIFELADVWTMGLEEDEYVEFLWGLLGHVSKSLPGDGELVWRDTSEMKWCEDLANGSKRKPLPEGPTPRQKQGKRVQQRRKGAKVIQAGSRGRRDRKSATERKQAVATIQASMRGHNDRRKVHKRRGAVVTIQKNARRRGAYRESSLLRSAILTVQASVRMLKAIKRFRKAQQKQATIDNRNEKLDMMRRRTEALRARRRALGALGALGAAAPEDSNDLIVQLVPLPAPEYDAKVIKEPSEYPSPLTVGVRRHASDVYLERNHKEKHRKAPKVKQRARYLDYMKDDPSKNRRATGADESSLAPPHRGFKRSVSLPPLRDHRDMSRTGSQQHMQPYVPKWGGSSGQTTRIQALLPVPLRHARMAAPTEQILPVAAPTRVRVGLPPDEEDPQPQTPSPTPESFRAHPVLLARGRESTADPIATLAAPASVTKKERDESPPWSWSVAADSPQPSPKKAGGEQLVPMAHVAKQVDCAVHELGQMEHPMATATRTRTKPPSIASKRSNMTRSVSLPPVIPHVDRRGATVATRLPDNANGRPELA